MEETKFNKIATEAAIDLLDRLNGELVDHRNSGKRWETENESSSNSREQLTIWATGEWLQCQLLQDSIDKLKDDIKTQSFDY